MTYDDMLAERLTALEALQRRYAGEDTPLVCDFCYSTFDVAGCLCGRMNWLPLGAAMSKLRLDINKAYDKRRSVGLETEAQLA